MTLWASTKLGNSGVATGPYPGIISSCWAACLGRMSARRPLGVNIEPCCSSQALTRGVSGKPGRIVWSTVSHLAAMVAMFSA